MPREVRAGSWGEPLAAEAIHEAWTVARESFIQSMVANLKSVASRLINSKVRALLTGSKSSGALFITDYNDFIFRSSERTAQVYANNLFRSITRDSSSYTRRVARVAENAIENELNKAGAMAKTTIDDYVSGGAENLFDETKGGGNAAMVELTANPYNNPYGAYVYGQMAVQRKITELEKSKVTEATSGGGFKSKVNPKTNLIDLPGSVLSDIVSMAESLPMMMVAYASTIPEVAGTMAAQIISQSIESGIADASNSVDNKLGEINRRVNGGVNSVQRNIYRGIKFTD